MIRRPRRSVPATIVAVVLLAACVLTVISVVGSLLGRTPLISLSAVLRFTSSQQWNGAATVAAAIVVAVLGLVLLLTAIRPGRPTVLPLARMTGADGSALADAGVRRATLVKDLATTAGEVPGVASASVSARRGSVTATVTVAATDPAAVPAAVEQRLTERLAEIGPAARMRVRVASRRAPTT